MELTRLAAILAVKTSGERIVAVSLLDNGIMQCLDVGWNVPSSPKGNQEGKSESASGGLHLDLGVNENGEPLREYLVG